MSKGRPEVCSFGAFRRARRINSRGRPNDLAPRDDSKTLRRVLGATTAERQLCRRQLRGGSGVGGTETEQLRSWRRSTELSFQKG